MDKPGAAKSRQTKVCKAEQFTTAWVLRKTMAVTKTTHKELCERHGMYHAEIELILRGGHVSLEMAQKLQNAFGSPALFWIKLDGRQQVTPLSYRSQLDPKVAGAAIQTCF